MDELFLHYIWKYQKFNLTDLSVSDGQSLKVFYQGNHNQDSGPDFAEARIKIGSIEWAGQVEIHINSSDWIHHKHQNDPAYKNVILHVVWTNDQEILIEGQPIPTLELKSIIDLDLIEKYKRHIQSTNEILCSDQFSSVPQLTKSSMLDRVLVERLMEKSDRILHRLKENKNDWEEVTYKTLAENFGFSTNKEAFKRLTDLLSFSVLKKILPKALETEALIFGQSGFLEGEGDDYKKKLRSEYDFISKKFQLPDTMVQAQWKFGKLRPDNFPTVRLSQFASLLHKHSQLFTFLTQTESMDVLKKKLVVSVSSYWQDHYDFGKPRKKPIETIGISSFENILINTVAPLLAAYSKYTDEQKFIDRAVELLESLSPESNRITRKWEPLDQKAKNAFESQAQIHLFKNYCQKKRCLQCNVGVKILSK
ncbi:DUF2851 family protein [Ekhidna sp.]